MKTHSLFYPKTAKKQFVNIDFKGGEIKMSIIIDEKKLMDDSLFSFEEKIKSPLSRFTDKNFTPVDYHHINNNETTADGGWNDVEEVLGENSPIRFQLIKNFPIYGLEAIIISLQDAEQGLDGSYEGEATILPGTIVPLQNDYFTIPILKDDYIFRVTEVSYDSIMPDNYYKISFMLEYIDHEKKDDLTNQSTEKYTCVLENIGTEDRCIIEDEYYEEIKTIDEIYDEMVKTYLTFFYNERYNCLLGDFYHGKKLYDPLQTVFINKNSLLNKKTDLKTIILTEQFEDSRRKVKYEKSLYRFIEKRNWDRLSTFKFTTFPGINNGETSFYRWADKSIDILDIARIPDDVKPYEMMSEDFVNIIKYDGPTDSPYAKLMKKYLRNEEEMSLMDIHQDLLDELLNLDDANLEIFFFTPIILYIIKYTVSEYLKKE